MAHRMDRPASEGRRPTSRAALALLVLWTAAGLPGTAASPPRGGSASSRTDREAVVEIHAESEGIAGQGWYAPATVVVPRGTMVTWINRDVRPHSVTSADGLFDSGLITPGGRWSRTFDAEGTFAYECYLCFCNPMTGRVVVEDSRSGPHPRDPRDEMKKEAEP